MKDILIPKGVVYFSGPYMELLRTIGNLHATMIDDKTFRCNLAFPRYDYERSLPVIIKGRMSFLFHCSIMQHKDAFKIEYKVYPSFFTAMYLLVGVYIFASCLLFSESGGILENLVASGILGCVFFLLFLLARRSCIRQFVQKIEGEDERNFS